MERVRELIGRCAPLALVALILLAPVLALPESGPFHGFRAALLQALAFALLLPLLARLSWPPPALKSFRTAGGHLPLLLLLAWAYPGLDWTWLLAQARQMGCERMLLLGLALAAELLGTALPSEIERRLQTQRKLPALVAYVRGTLFEETDDLSPTARRLKERAYLLALRERAGDRAGYWLQLAQGAFVPGEADRAVLSLPAPLSPLYYLLRPLRLTGKYGLLLLRRRQ